jgi:hypothetical protein
MYSIEFMKFCLQTMAKTSIRARLEPAREKDMPMLSNGI